MVSLQKKILQFADKKTKHDIEQLEQFLHTDNLAAAKTLTTQADEEADIQMKSASELALSVEGETPKTGGAWLPKGWASRWLSPDETLRQIIRDITIATVWFSIMLGEFDIFNKYNQLITSEVTDNWIQSQAMTELLVANKQLGLTTAVNNDNKRKLIYLDRIVDYLENTDLVIRIVESSGYNFIELNNIPRIKVCSFKILNDVNYKNLSTILEAKSLLKAYYYYNLQNFKNIIKITGKYYIPNLNDIIQKVDNSADLFLQYRSGQTDQNTEIFGIKSIHFKNVINEIINKYNESNGYKYMELTVFTYLKSKMYRKHIFPKINLTKFTKRGDDSILEYL
jgi:hypothetical protein